MPSFDDLLAAAERIAPYAHRTPVLTSAFFDGVTGAALHFKCENLQRVGAFKFRGATNAVFSLTEEQARRGVATHSSGNHAQALALAARLRGTRATIVMPHNTARAKQEATRGYGAEVLVCEPTLGARERALEQVVAASGAVVVHPYDDERVIAGQGTAALELQREVPGLDLLLVPVGGGGLLAGTILAAGGVAPGTRVIGVEPAAADDARRSLEAGRILPSQDPRTLADGLRTSLGVRNFAIIRAGVEAIVTVSEGAIVRAMRSIWERMKLVVEPSGAVPVAALLEGAVDVAGLRVGVILSGGNADLDALPWLR